MRSRNRDRLTKTGISFKQLGRYTLALSQLIGDTVHSLKNATGAYSTLDLKFKGLDLEPSTNQEISSRA